MERPSCYFSSIRDAKFPTFPLDHHGSSSRITNALIQIGPIAFHCQRGCDEIRAVQAKRIEEGNTLQVDYKDGKDNPRCMSLDRSRSCSTISHCIGEDDDDDDEELQRLIQETSFDPLDKTLFENDIGETPEINVSEICIHVDPLDG